MRIILKLSVLAIFSALFFVACTPSAEEAKPMDMDKVKADIQAMEDAFAAGEKAKDAAAVAAYYSSDAISYNRNQEPASGKAAITESIAKRIASDTTGNHSVYKVVDIFAEGSLLVEIGSFTSLNPAGAEVDKGHYMSVFKKQADGKYQCIRDMNVTSMPAK
jgi:ketosteroid isomerase-like protein